MTRNMLCLLMTRCPVSLSNNAFSLLTVFSSDCHSAIATQSCHAGTDNLASWCLLQKQRQQSSPTATVLNSGAFHAVILPQFRTFFAQVTVSSLAVLLLCASYICMVWLTYKG